MRRVDGGHDDDDDDDEEEYQNDDDDYADGGDGSGCGAAAGGGRGGSKPQTPQNPLILNRYLRRGSKFKFRLPKKSLGLKG